MEAAFYLVSLIIYAGAIMVLFIFVVIMLNFGRTRYGSGTAVADTRDVDRSVILASLLLIEVVYLLFRGAEHNFWRVRSRQSKWP
jgi:NADH:ubiquinone oxidoreductase subunit 6 (subunit J)